MRKVRFYNREGNLVEVNIENFTMEQRQEMNLSVYEAGKHFHENTGVSNSWLRRLQHELDKLGCNVTDRALVQEIIDNHSHYATWDEVVAAIKMLLARKAEKGHNETE